MPRAALRKTRPRARWWGATAGVLDHRIKGVRGLFVMSDTLHLSGKRMDDAHVSIRGSAAGHEQAGAASWQCA